MAIKLTRGQDRTFTVKGVVVLMLDEDVQKRIKFGIRFNVIPTSEYGDLLREFAGDDFGLCCKLVASVDSVEGVDFRDSSNNEITEAEDRKLILMSQPEIAFKVVNLYGEKVRTHQQKGGARRGN